MAFLFHVTVKKFTKCLPIGTENLGQPKSIFSGPAITTHIWLQNKFSLFFEVRTVFVLVVMTPSVGPPKVHFSQQASPIGNKVSATAWKTLGALSSGRLWLSALWGLSQLLIYTNGQFDYSELVI